MRTVIAGTIRDEDLTLAERLQGECSDLKTLNTFGVAVLCKRLGISSKDVEKGQDWIRCVCSRIVSEAAIIQYETYSQA